MTSDVLTPGFTERWIADVQIDALAALVRSVRDVSGAIVEIGVWEGLSAVAIANACHPRELECVDHWKGDLDDPRGWGVSPELAASRPVYDQFSVNMRHFTSGANYMAFVMGWQEYVRTSLPRSIAFLHLDAAHDTASVRDCLKALLPVAAPGGVFCGDDWMQASVQQGVREAFAGSGISVSGMVAGCPNLWAARIPT
jgi:hypothetical protein